MVKFYILTFNKGHPSATQAIAEECPVWSLLRQNPIPKSNVISFEYTAKFFHDLRIFLNRHRLSGKLLTSAKKYEDLQLTGRGLYDKIDIDRDVSVFDGIGDMEVFFRWQSKAGRMGSVNYRHL